MRTLYHVFGIANSYYAFVNFMHGDWRIGLGLMNAATVIYMLRNPWK